MTESFAVEPPLHTREARAVPWRETNPEAVQEMKEIVHELGITLEPVAFRSGGILEPAASAEASENTNHFAHSTKKAVVLGRTRGSIEPNVVIHFPPKLEQKRFDATYFAYQTYVGEYLRAHWKPEALGMNPLPGIVASSRMDDGRYVTAIRFRRNFEPLGAEGFATGIHVMDVSRILPEEMGHLVDVLDAIHMDTAAFQKWVQHTNSEIPKESWLHRDNPGFAYRGKEWWISPHGGDDRMKELTKKAESFSELFTSIDATFDASKAIPSFITNNIELYPHADGHVDHPELVGDAVVAHGSLYPDNVHIQRSPDKKIHFTISGGDRAQGYGLRGQMIDWLVTATAGSPEHQKALLDAFIRLHPSQKDRRGLAMHVLYRSVMETPWFIQHSRMKEAGSLAQLTYDILQGNGIWKGTETPLSA